MNSVIPADFKSKTFWQRPEGTTGKIFSVLLLGGFGWLAYKLLPFIAVIMESTLRITLCGVALFAIWLVLSNKDFQTAVSNLFQNIMRGLTQIVIELDPIGILKNYVDYLHEQYEKMCRHITALSSQIRILRNRIESNEKQRQDALRMAGAARQQSNQQQFVLKARKAGRLEQSNISLQQLLTKMELLHRVLQKMRDTAAMFIEDIESEIQTKTDERNSMKAGHSAMKAAMSIFRGNDPQAAMFQQAMDFLTEDYGRKMGEVEEFMEMSSGFIGSVDMQNGIYEADALRMLEEWEKKSDSLLLAPGEKQQIIFDTHDFNNQLDLDSPQPVLIRRNPNEGGESKAWSKLIR